mgnify:CR=1 FL=1
MEIIHFQKKTPVNKAIDICCSSKKSIKPSNDLLLNRLRGEKIDSNKAKLLLSKVNLSHVINNMPSTLSGGMRRRLLIAKAMVHNPEILILDEPTAGVDVELRANLWANINKLNNEGKTIIITTHYLHEAEELCNEIAIIDNGNFCLLYTSPSPRD